MPCPRLKTWPSPGQTGENSRHFFFNTRRRAYSIEGIHIALSRLYDRRDGAHRRYRWSSRVPAHRSLFPAIASSHRPPPLVNSVTGTRAAFVFTAAAHQRFCACNRARTADNRAPVSTPPVSKSSPTARPFNLRIQIQVTLSPAYRAAHAGPCGSAYIIFLIW